MLIIDMRVRNYMHKLPRHKPAGLREHHQQDGILNDIPVVCRQNILRALIQNRVQLIARHIESHAVSARLQIHLGQILKIIDVRHNTP